MLENKKIFITGAGSIGSEILDQLLKYNIHSVRIFDNNELKLHNLRQKYKSIRKVKYLFGDIRDEDRLAIGMRDIDIVFHTAAMKHVNFCEFNPIDAVKSNVIGTQNVINTSLKENVEKFINISTDKAVNPINVMGATKLLSERMVVSASNYKGKKKTIFYSVRFGNVIGSTGSVLSIFKEQIKKNKCLSITDPSMTRFIMSIKDSVKLIFDTINIAKGEEVFILKMPSVKIMDMASIMLNKKNVGIDIIGINTKEKLHELLINEEESKSAYENSDMIVLLPRELEDHYIKRNFKKMKIGSISSKDNNFISKIDLEKLIEDIGND